MISDANVIIDCEKGNLTSKILNPSFPHKIAVPNILFEQELEEQHNDLLKMGLTIRTVNPQFIQKAVAFRNKYRQLSPTDCLALSLALQEKCPLLTGDKALRNPAIQENVHVHGTLYLIDELFKARLLNPQEAEYSFELMKRNGRRLPWNAGDKLLSKHSLVEARNI